MKIRKDMEVDRYEEFLGNCTIFWIENRMFMSLVEEKTGERNRLWVSWKE